MILRSAVARQMHQCQCAFRQHPSVTTNGLIRGQRNSSSSGEGKTSGKWMERLRSASEKQWEGLKQKSADVSKNAVASTKSRLQNSIQQATEASSRIASQASTSATEAAKKSADVVRQQASSSYQNSKSVLSQKASEYSQQAGQAVSQAAQRSGQAASRAAQESGRAAADAVKESAQGAASSVGETVQKMGNRVFWWGLAAVAVYGVSTTLTQEGFRYLTKGSSSNRTKDGE